jgi:putative transposase
MESINAFPREIQKGGLEKIFKGEINAHLGYDKYEETLSIAKNGSKKKVIKTEFS